MRTTMLMALASVSLLLAGEPLVAHHSFASEYDATKPITLRGKVTRFDWINPHAWIYIDVAGADGKVVNWAVECGAPNALVRRGWRKDALPIGTEIVVDGYLAKSGKPMTNGSNLSFPDGRTLFVGSSGTGAPEPKPR